jgi:hypothetical protein
MQYYVFIVEYELSGSQNNVREVHHTRRSYLEFVNFLRNVDINVLVNIILLNKYNGTIKGLAQPPPCASALAIVSIA